MMLGDFGDDDEIEGMNAQEEKSLQRVYDHMAHFRAKKREMDRLEPLLRRKELIEAHFQGHDLTIRDEATGATLALGQIRREYENITSQM